MEDIHALCTLCSQDLALYEEYSGSKNNSLDFLAVALNAARSLPGACCQS